MASAENGLKICTNTECSELNPQSTDNFYPDRTGNPKDKLCCRCKTCVSLKSKVYLAGNRVKIRETRLKSTYGISIEDYNDLFNLQNGCCAICKKHQSNFKKRLDIDHDHSCCPGNKSCGKCIRGLLCTKCNKAIGLLGDSAKSVEDALNYLRSSES